MHDAHRLEVRQHLDQIFAAERFVGGERQLERGAPHVVHQDEQLVGRNPRMLGRRIDEELRIADDELVERIAGRDHYAERCTIASSRATETLPGAGDRARIAVQEAHVERADVDAELERVGRDHAVERAFAQLSFGLAALPGKITTAIRGDARRLSRIVVERVLQILGQHFDHQSRVREHDRLQPRRDRRTREARRLRSCRCSQPEVGIDHRGIPKQQVFLS